jgi:hypothetical protein
MESRHGVDLRAGLVERGAALDEGGDPLILAWS